MFVIERLLKTAKPKVDDNMYSVKQCKSNNDDYYSLKNRMQRKIVNSFDPSGFFAFIFLIVIFYLIFSFFTGMAENDKKEKNMTRAGMTCRMFNKGDHVAIQYGDYENLRGILVGGCNDGENYQVKLDEKQGIEDGYKDDNSRDKKIKDVSNFNISVDSYKNLVVIE